MYSGFCLEKSCTGLRPFGLLIGNFGSRSLDLPVPRINDLKWLLVLLKIFLFKYSVARASHCYPRFTHTYWLSQFLSFQMSAITPITSSVRLYGSKHGLLQKQRLQTWKKLWNWELYCFLLNIFVWRVVKESVINIPDQSLQSLRETEEVRFEVSIQFEKNI